MHRKVGRARHCGVEDEDRSCYAEEPNPDVEPEDFVPLADDTARAHAVGGWGVGCRKRALNRK